MYLILFANLISLVLSQPLVFPHGYFDSNKLKPFDAIYLNLLAQSNLEYGGVTLKELDGLDAQRKVIPRPPTLGRTREEDAKILDRQPKADMTSEDKSHMQDHETSDTKMDGNSKSKAKETMLPPPKSPFKRMLHDDPMDNPFEEIATRSPPRSSVDFLKAKRKLRKHHRASASSSLSSSHRHHHNHHSHRRHHASDEKGNSIELDNLPTRRPPASERKTTTERPPTPTLIPLSQQVSSNRFTFRRHPNNPYTVVDIREPTILRLPVPPIDRDEKSEEEFH